MKRIMFVCHGNICRSTMAEFVMADMIRRAGLEGEISVASSATSTEEIGNPPHGGTVRVLKKHGVPIYGHEAVQLERRDYEKYDLLVGMDSANIRNMHRMLGGDPDGKIMKLLDGLGGTDVADPWYTGDFETTYRDVIKGCTYLLEKVRKM